LFLPLLLLPLRSPLVLLTVPVLAAQMLSSREALWTTGFHYYAVVWPVLVLAAVDGARRFGPRVKPVLAAGMTLMGLTVVSLGMVTSGAMYPLAGLFEGSVAQASQHARNQAALVGSIPVGTCVEADNWLVPHLTPTNRVALPDTLATPPDFLALDRSKPVVGIDRPPPDDVERRALKDGYEPIARYGDLVLLRRPGFTGPTTACKP
jgi:hypothetical protein